MKPDGQDAGLADQIEPADPAAFTAEETERLVRLFQILDEWDRQAAARDISRADVPTVPFAGPGGTHGPQPVPVGEE
jgi:hypothetical protein